MRIKKFFADKLMNTAIFQLAHDRYTARNRISELTSHIFTNLVKVRTIDNPYYNRAWRNEINAWADEICVRYLTTERDKPNHKELFEWMLFDNYNKFTEINIDKSVYKWEHRDYPQLTYRAFYPHETLSKVLRVMKRMSKDISAGHYVTIDDYI